MANVFGGSCLPCSVTFEPPEDIEAARIVGPSLGQETLLYARLGFPNIRKPRPPVTSKRGRHSCGFLRFFACSVRREDEDDEFQDDPCSLPHSWTPLFGHSVKSLSLGEWIPIPSRQKPSNGDVWMRVTRNRLSFMIIVSTTAPEPQTSPPGLSETSGISEMCHTTYYYWDSGKLIRSIDATKSKIMVSDGDICLLLADADQNGWTDEDLHIIQNNPAKSTSSERKENEIKQVLNPATKELSAECNQDEPEERNKKWSPENGLGKEGVERNVAQEIEGARSRVVNRVSARSEFFLTFKSLKTK